MGAELKSTILYHDANLQGYWRLENSLSDESPNSYTLTDHSSTDDASGQFGHARAFASASSQYCDITNASAPNLYSTSDQTITAWIKPTGFTGPRSIFSNSNSSVNAGFSFQTEPTTGKLEFRSFKSGDDQSVLSSGALSSGVWTHVAVVFTASGNAVAVFVNGTKTSGSFTRALVATTANTAIGRLGDFNGQYFDGSIDDVAFFNRALTDAEVQNLSSGTPSTTSTSSSTSTTTTSTSTTTTSTSTTTTSTSTTTTSTSTTTTSTSTTTTSTSTSVTTSTSSSTSTTTTSTSTSISTSSSTTTSTTIALVFTIKESDLASFDVTSIDAEDFYINHPGE